MDRRTTAWFQYRGSPDRRAGEAAGIVKQVAQSLLAILLFAAEGSLSRSVGDDRQILFAMDLLQRSGQTFHDWHDFCPGGKNAGLGRHPRSRQMVLSVRSPCRPIRSDWC